MVISIGNEDLIKAFTALTDELDMSLGPGEGRRGQSSEQGDDGELHFGGVGWLVYLCVDGWDERLMLLLSDVENRGIFEGFI